MEYVVLCSLLLTYTCNVCPSTDSHNTDCELCLHCTHVVCVCSKRIRVFEQATVDQNTKVYSRSPGPQKYMYMYIATHFLVACTTPRLVKTSC